MSLQKLRSLNGTKVVSPAKLAHVVFQTNRFKDMVAWYEAVLGARVVFSQETICFLTYDDEHHRIAIAAMPDVEDKGQMPQAGVHHVAFTFATMGDLLSNYKRLKKGGIVPIWSINHGPTTSMYYEDPDKNHVELQIDNFATEEELQAFMDTGVFVENPIGVDYDPDILCERYEAGDPESELIKLGSAPKSLEG